MHKRESYPFYIGATESEIKEMLGELGLNSLEDLYSHIDGNNKFTNFFHKEHLSREEIKDHISQIALKNRSVNSFIGSGLLDYGTPPMVNEICSIRGLTTAYTPYQPERSQGTLLTLWIYQSALSLLTGFEAINASMYERSTCLFEAIQCANRLTKKNKVLIVDSIYSGDIEVLRTLVDKTETEIEFISINNGSSRANQDLLEKKLQEDQSISAIVFPQVNTFGVIEKVDALTDLASQYKVKSIAIIDPLSIGNNGLKPPIEFGSEAQGCDIFVAEGQFLSIDSNYGGPGLGIFGIRYNDTNKLSIRQTPGRYIGNAKDIHGKICKSLVLSTREQHIRREKATSNICSNQSFIASLAGANLLAWGADGISEKSQRTLKLTHKLGSELSQLKGVKRTFPNCSYGTVCFTIDYNIDELITKARSEDLEIGINVSDRANHKNTIAISITSKKSDDEFQKLISFFQNNFTKEDHVDVKTQSSYHYRKKDFVLKAFDKDEIFTYYKSLGDLNLSPDDGIYPLGSCTMKYNPYINDEMAGLEGFTSIHPATHPSNAQGCLEILYNVQEIFKSITGLPGVTTQPVAGAQGELVGIKMFQAYHADKGEEEKRKLILIPKSAHGTNPATASVAGFKTKKIDGIQYGIIPINSTDQGEIDIEQIKLLCETRGSEISGIMVTNPNTAGIFESKFKQMSEMIHNVGGLVYMDGANMNAIAGWIDLDKIGVDAVHNNLHKTWTIPHGGGGPGDAIVAVSSKLIDYMPGVQIKRDGENYSYFRPAKSIGSFHRHFGNFAHKVRAYSYLCALGSEGVKKMSAVSVLSARYLFHKLNKHYPTLPEGSEKNPRMHEFIITLNAEMFAKLSNAGVPKAKAMAQIGKLYLDFGLHAPTVAFPEQFGLMIEPTESYTKTELDQFYEVVKDIAYVINEYPHFVKSAPHFTPVAKVDEVAANKFLDLSEKLELLPKLHQDVIYHRELAKMSNHEIIERLKTVTSEL